MKKAYVLTWDAMVALAFVFILFIGFTSVQYLRSVSTEKTGFERAKLVSEDALDVLNKEGVLDEIGYQWSIGNFSNSTELKEGKLYGASEIAKEKFDPIIPEYVGYRLLIADDLIYESANRIPESSAEDETKAVRMVSGFATNQSVSGWVARAWLLKNSTYVLQNLSNGTTQSPEFTVFFTLNESHYLYMRIPLAAKVTEARLNLTG